jgi:hypothetical protein
MSDVFISYSREDRAEAEALASVLLDRGLSVFWDRNIIVGEAFEEVIEREIGQARTVVVLWSTRSVSSNWVRAEAAEAANRGILIPALLDDAQPPLRYRIAQTANLSDWRPGELTESFDHLVRDICDVVADKNQVHLQSGTRASPRRTTRRTRVMAVVRLLILVSLFFAWIGSFAMALTIAFDFGVASNVLNPRVYSTAYFTTVWCFVLGGLATASLGFLSLANRFTAGVLQGWLWPAITGVAQLLLQLGATQLLLMPSPLSELEAILVMIVLGSLGPTVLSTTALATVRALDRISSRDRQLGEERASRVPDRKILAKSQS